MQIAAMAIGPIHHRSDRNPAIQVRLSKLCGVHGSGRRHMEVKDTSTSLETPRQHQFTFNLILTYYSIMSEHTFRMRGHDVFAAVGDPTRRAMLDLLRKGEL